MILNLMSDSGSQADVDFDVEGANLDDPKIIAELVKAIKEARDEVLEDEEDTEEDG